ncbi:hypothetical protein ACT691_00975 [Vibrio metschnikovii]
MLLIAQLVIRAYPDINDQWSNATVYDRDYRLDIGRFTGRFPVTGGADITILKMVNGSLHPVIADMAGVLLFIGVMEKTGFST